MSEFLHPTVVVSVNGGTITLNCTCETGQVVQVRMLTAAATQLKADLASAGA
jgi:hypothetical protein